MNRRAAVTWWSAAAIGLCLAVALFVVSCGSNKSSKVTGVQSGQHGEESTNVSGDNAQGSTTAVKQTTNQNGTATGTATDIDCTGSSANANSPGGGTANGTSRTRCGNVTVQLTLDTTIDSSINTSIGSSISVSN